jgi:hypothetical protein
MTKRMTAEDAEDAGVQTLYVLSSASPAIEHSS